MRGSVGQTSDRQTRTEEPIEVLREHRIVLRKKLKLLIAGKLTEPRSSKIEFRTWPDLKYVYGKAPSIVKSAARKAFESVVLSWFLGETEKIEAALGEGRLAVFNINIAEAKAEAKVSVRIINDLNELLSFLEWLAYQSDPNRYPNPVRQKAAKYAKVLREALNAISN